MKIPAGTYVSWKPQCSEVCSWYGESGKRGQRKGGRVWVNKEMWNIFPSTQLLSNILEFTHI
jgi:hypothetical protein